MSTITYSQSTIPRLKVFKRIRQVFENWDSCLDTTKAHSFRKDALVMSCVLDLYIFIEEDILEIEFSSFKTTPDVAQGFIKLKLRCPTTSL